jgi:hypothetical protein
VCVVKKERRWFDLGRDRKRKGTEERLVNRGRPGPRLPKPPTTCATFAGAGGAWSQGESLLFWRDPPRRRHTPDEISVTRGSG